MQARGWIGTSYTLALTFLSPKISFAIWQKELCPTTKREHLQFFLYLHRKTRLNGVKDLLSDNTVHLEVARDVKASIAYCSKQETRLEGPWTLGNIPYCGAFNALSILQSLTVQQTVTEYPNLWRSWRTLTAIRASLLKPRHAPPILCIALTGETGTGKSRICQTISSFTGSVYWKAPNKWWDHYNQQQQLILDDFRSSDYTIQFLLRLLDGYPLQVETKGGSTEIDSCAIFITSNVPLDLWYPESDLASRKALNRRIKQYIVY